MAFDLQQLGMRLKEARENRGLSQEQVAGHLGLPRTAITHMESGNRQVSTLELSQLAELYHRSIADFFADIPLSQEDPLLALHRIGENLVGDPVVNEELSRCVSICRDGVELQKLLGRPERMGPPAYKLPAPTNIGEAVQQAAEVAAAERRRLELANTPIADIAELISAQDIWASGARLPDAMSGLFLRHPSIGMAILVNFDHVRARKRFSYAHEYGHALMDRALSATVSMQSNASDLLEKRANAFAAAFLMPSGGVQELLKSMNKGQPSRVEEMVYDVANSKPFEAQARPAPGSQVITYQDVAVLALHFGVSYQAAAYRLLSLRLITKPEGEHLLSQADLGNQYLSVVDFLGDLEDTEPKKRQDRELVAAVVHLATEAFRREEISKGRLLELSKKLNVPGRKLLELAEAAR
jgi:Zn-dependent peptidase ImmA (M78 family)/transcriptional regulator with XRE-family HTH domain